ncbi:MAG: dTMP kinase [Planctomycetota bacterium]
MTSKSRFIVFEGLDGAGTSTQLHLLQRALENKSIGVEATKEPSTGPLGALIRQAIEGRLILDQISLSLAFAADRADHLFNVHNGIMKSLNADRWVISDRYVLSNLAYQAADGVDVDLLLKINSFAKTPDLTIFVDTDPVICMDRIQNRSTHFELYHHLPKLELVKNNYVKFLSNKDLTGSLLIVSGLSTREEIHHQIWKYVRELFLNDASLV